MKTRNAILTFSLAALAFGAAAGLAMHHANAVETRAEPASTFRVYLDMSGYTDWYKDGASFKVHTWNDAHKDQYVVATKLADAYYYADVEVANVTDGGYRFTRYNGDGSQEWNRGEWCTYNSANLQTYYKPSGMTAGTWSQDDQKTWKVVGAPHGGSWGQVDIALTMRFNNEGLSFYSTEVVLTAETQFKVNQDGTENYYGYNCIETGPGSVIDLSLVSGEGDSNITVLKSGTYEIYMKPFTGKFWMQENSVASATAFSEDFLLKTDTACAAAGDDHGNALKEIWNPKNKPDGTSLCEKWDALTIGAKNAFKTSEDDTIVSARARYLFLVGKYNVLTPFSQGPAAARYSVGLTETNNTLLVVSIVSALTVVTVAGLFLFKKKKSIR